jgi:hypothetical protein
LANASVTYKQCADADLVEVTPEVAMSGLRLRPRPWWPRVLGILIGGGAAAAGIRAWRMRQAPADEIRPRHTLPETMTPFSVLQFLRSIEADEALKDTVAAHPELAGAIRDLEQSRFGRPTNGRPQPDLENIARRWQARTSAR